MRYPVLAASLIAALIPLSPALARTQSGFTVRTTVMRAGPDSGYPVVSRLRQGVGVTVFGCLRDWSWCDVSTRADRGWVSSRNLVVSYQGQRRSIMPTMGIGVLSFMFGSYWNDNYRQRPFYAQMQQWQQHYTTGFRPEFGGTRPSALPMRSGPRQPGGGGQHGMTQYQPSPPVRTMPRTMVMPAHPTPAPVPRQSMHPEQGGAMGQGMPHATSTVRPAATPHSPNGAKPAGPQNDAQMRPQPGHDHQQGGEDKHGK